MRVEFLCADTACRYLRGIKAHRADNGKGKILYGMRDSLDIRGLEGGNGFGGSQSLRSAEGCALNGYAESLSGNFP